MSGGKVYLLQYCEDDGSREAWSVFYTPIEAFGTKELRDARIEHLRSGNEELEFEETDLEFMTDPKSDD
jgi:hypothetical protein